MTETIDDLRCEVERLRKELAALRRTPDQLSPACWTSHFSAAKLATVLLIGAAWTAYAQAPSPIPSAPEAQIFNLIKRVTALEERLSRPLTVRAPFRVVDERGRDVMSINDGAFILSHLDKPKVLLGLVGEDGMARFIGAGGETTEVSSNKIRVSSAEGTTYSSMTIDTIELKGSLGAQMTMTAKVGVAKLDMKGLGNNRAVLRANGLAIAAEGKSVGVMPEAIALMDRGDVEQGPEDTSAGIRAHLGPGDKGNMALRIMNASGMVAAIGEDPSYGNAGAVKIHDTNGAIVAGMIATGVAQGSVDVFGPSGTSVASLGIQDNGRGFVAVWNSAGVAVSALNENTAGGGGNVTTTDPAGNGVFSAGWIGSGGASCVNRSESKGLWCLGTNIPMGIGANPKR